MVAVAPVPIARHTPENRAVAAAWLVSDALMFAVMNVLVQMNMVDVEPRVALFFRYAFSLPILFVALRSWRITVTWPIVLCAGTSLAANLAWYQALAKQPLSVSTTVFYTKGLFLVLLAALFLGERPRSHHIAACLAGLAGVALITGVDSASLRIGVLFVLVSAFASAAMILQIRSLSLSMTPLRLTSALVLIGTPLSLLLALPVWQWPSAGALASFAVAAVLTVGIHIAIANAYKRSTVSSLAPFDFLRLVFVLGIEILFLGLHAPLQAWGGAALILIAVVFNTIRDKRCLPTPST